MNKKILKFFLSLVLACFVLGAGFVAYKVSKNNILAAIAAITITYTLSKPIQNDYDEREKKSKKLKVVIITTKSEKNLDQEINKKLNNLRNNKHEIQAIKILTPKSVLIEYLD